MASSLLPLLLGTLFRLIASQSDFDTWVSSNVKTYSSREETAFRQSVFSANLARVETWVQRHARPAALHHPDPNFIFSHHMRYLFHATANTNSLLQAQRRPHTDLPARRQPLCGFAPCGVRLSVPGLPCHTVKRGDATARARCVGRQLVPLCAPERGARTPTAGPAGRRPPPLTHAHAHIHCERVLHSYAHAHHHREFVLPAQQRPAPR
jgi:hypothetical protein